MTRKPADGTIWIASFDIGKRNFAFCVEEVRVHELESVQNVPKAKRYFKDGTCTPAFAETLQQLYHTGSIVMVDNVDLVAMGNVDPKKYYDPGLLINMMIVLDNHKEYWDNCVAFVIEEQMNFQNKRNHMAVKLGQHCMSYFLFQYANFKKTVEFPARNKTRVLGAPKKMSKPQRKSWAVREMMSILINRGDKDTLTRITSSRKKDDMADVIMQLQSYKYLFFVDQTL